MKNIISRHADTSADSTETKEVPEQSKPTVTSSTSFVHKPIAPPQDRSVVEIFNDGSRHHMDIIRILSEAGINKASEIPKDEEQLIAIKGIGKKTARTIMEAMEE